MNTKPMVTMLMCGCFLKHRGMSVNCILVLCRLSDYLPQLPVTTCSTHQLRVLVLSQQSAIKMTAMHPALLL
jgi:hypothetical protein